MKSHHLLSLSLAFALPSAPAHAWDQKGHRVVAAVAWEHMDASTRTKAVAILRAAPLDSDLLAEDAGTGLTEGQRDRALFLRAATWPDIVRDFGHPALLAHSPSAAIPLRHLGGRSITILRGIT